MPDWSSRIHMAEDITEVAGMTPLLRLRKVAAGPQTLCGKLEFMNPSASLKDRILRHMVRRAEERGELRPGMTILEASTGNTGIAAAMIGAAKGYSVVIVMPEGMSEERKACMRAYGAQLVLTPGAESDVDLCLEK
ncbi:MAG: pyridoxal-phosphate dependent enzyme, partial [Dehalococcoidia bacterium]